VKRQPVATRVRPSAVAGRFYPANAGVLAETVDRLVADVEVPAAEPAAAAYVVPHAGYQYSGPVAASVYARLRGRAVRRVVLLGPSHYVPFGGIAAPATSAFATPLGEVRVDPAARSLPGVVVDEVPHSAEHSLEVQLPFLQRVLPGEWVLLPLVVGRVDAGQVADVLTETSGDATTVDLDTVVLVSTDLSHYLPYDGARWRDRRTASYVLGHDPAAIRRDDACGCYALRGLVEHARVTGRRVRLLDLRNSGDTAGDRSRVVGYGAFAVDYPSRIQGSP
jgi:AmmeMemoRadiSam system protein B